MTKWPLPSGIPDAEIHIPRLAREQGLIVSESTLKSLPANFHWHFRKPGTSGTLEATWLIGTQQGWLSVHDSRQADWIEEAAAIIGSKLSVSG